MPYVNIDERYGSNEQVTIEDYQELNPEGTFEESERGGKEVIVEITDDNQYIVVAEATEE